MSRQLLPGQQPPLAVITPDDQGGAILVTGGMTLAVAAVSIVVRAYVRAGYLNNTFGPDDIVIMVASIFLVAESAALFRAANQGLGKTTDLIKPSHLPSIQQAIYATELLYLLTLWLTRFSSALFFVRLSRTTSHKWASRALFLAGALFTLASIFTIALRCDLTHPWLFDNAHCTGLFDRWLAVTILDVIYEVALFCVPCYIILGLQMPGRTKAKVISAFASRLLVIVPLILHLTAIRPFFVALTDGHVVKSYETSKPWIYTQITLCVGIVTATIPSLRPFMMATATSFGLVTGSASNSYGDRMSGVRSKSGGGGRMRSGRHNGSVGLNSASGDGDASGPSGMKGGGGRWGRRSQERRQGYSATVEHPDNHERDASIGSDVSHQPIIRRDVQYTVSYGDGTSTAGTGAAREDEGRFI